MNSGCLLIQESAEHWTLIVPDGSQQSGRHDLIASSMSDLVASICAVLGPDSEKASRIVIAPATDSVFFSFFRQDAQLIGKTQRRSWLYQMESSLPLDAEEMVADFVSDDQGISGIAIPVANWSDLVQSFDNAGIHVVAISPLSVLAASELVHAGYASAGDLVSWTAHEQTELMLLGQGGLVRWRHFPSNRDRLTMELAALDSSECTVPGKHLTIDTSDTNEQAHGAQIELTQQQAAESAADRILSHLQSPWYNLAREQLAPSDRLHSVAGPLRFLIAAVVLLLGVVTAVGQYRGFRYAAERDRLIQQQREVFKSTFPGKRVPAALLSRLRSEHRKVVASRSTGEEVPLPQSGLVVLSAMLSGTPEDVRYQVDKITIEDGRLRMDLKLPNHQAAGQFAVSISKSGFDVVPPGTEQIDPKTVVSQIEAQYSAELIPPVEPESPAPTPRPAT